jgi:tetratricopeptide (TPR) repeat protein
MSDNDESRLETAPRGLENVVFMNLPAGYAPNIGTFNLDPGIPLPIETAEAKESFNPALLSRERILAGMLKVLGAFPEHEHAPYYRSFILSVQPELFKDLTATGILKAKNGEFEVAEDIFRALVGLAPESALTWVNLANVYLERSKTYQRLEKTQLAEHFTELAYKTFKKARLAGSDDPEILFRVASFYLSMMDFDQAKELFSAALSCGLEGENKSMAEGALRKLNSQGSLDNLFKEAYDFIRMGEEEKGIEKIEEFLEAYPKVWNAWFILGWGHRRLSHWEKGQEAFAKALELCEPGPDCVDSLNELSICQIELGDMANAKRNLEKALRYEPENVKIISNLGLLALKAGKVQEAERFFLTAVEIEPEDEVAQSYLKQIESL